MQTQAKMRCSWNQPTQWSTEESPAHVVRLTPVYDADPDHPNFGWSKATPSGQVELTITNPAAFENFEVNKEYLLTFEEA
jgi:hypothetical protein